MKSVLNYKRFEAETGPRQVKALNSVMEEWMSKKERKEVKDLNKETGTGPDSRTDRLISKRRASVRKEERDDKAQKYGDASANRAVIQFKYERKMRSYNKRSHIEEQSGSILDIDFRELLKHEELIIDICLFGAAIATSPRLISTLIPMGILLNKYLRRETKSEFSHMIQWIKSQITHDINEQAATCIDPSFEKPQAWWSAVRHSKMWGDIYKLIAYCTCITVHGFDTEKLKKAQKYVCDTTIMRACNRVKFVDSVSAIVENVCTRVYQSFQAGSVLHFFHGGDTYQEWFNSTLRVEHDYYEKQNDDNFDRHGLLKEVMELIRQGEEIIKVQESKSISGRPERKLEASKGVSVVRKRLRSLIDLRQLLMNVMNSVKLRETPFSLLICGCSSIGKSIFSEIMRRHFGHIRNLSDTPSYVRNSALPHWENWESFYWSILLDDAACFKPDKLIGIDPSLAEIIQIINPISVQPPRADLSDKGRAAIQAKLVMITTNVADLNVNTYFSHPAAVMRRCGYQLILQVKPEFKSQASQGLDSFKAVHGDDEYPDWWDITVRQPYMYPDQDPGIDRSTLESCTKESCTFIPVMFEEGGVNRPMVKVGMKTYLKWYNQAIDQHFQNQQKILLSQKRIGNVPLCKHNLPTGMCLCNEVESESKIEEQAGAVCRHFLPLGECDCTLPGYESRDIGTSTTEDSILQAIQEAREEKSKKFHLSFNAKTKMVTAKTTLKAVWETISIPAAFAAVALFLLKDTNSEPKTNVMMRYRNVIYDKFRIGWDFYRLALSWVLPLWFWPSMALLYIPLIYAVLHPMDTLFIWTGDSLYYNKLCTSLSYLRQAAVLWLAIKADKAIDCIRAMGNNTSLLLGGAALCLLVVCALGKMIKYFCGIFSGTEDSMQDSELAAMDAADSELVEQGQAFSYGKPFNAKGEPESCYARPRTELDILDIPLHSKSLKGMLIEDVVEFYAPNLFHVITKDKTNTTPFGECGNMLFIKGHLGIIQTHVLKHKTVVRLRMTVDAHKGTTKNFETHIDATNIQPLGAHLRLIEVKSTSLKKNLTLSLPNPKIRSFKGKGFLMKRTNGGLIEINKVFNVRFVDTIGNLFQSGWIYKPERKTENGDCGSLLFIMTPSGPVLVGMHQYGLLNTDEGAATDLTTLEESIVRITRNEIEPGSLCKEKGKAGNLVELHEKSIASTTTKPITCEVYGSFDGHRQKAKSNVQRTIFAEKLEEQGHVIEYGKPDMSYQASNRHFESLEHASAYRHEKVMRIAMNAYLDHVMEAADGQWEDECHIVDQSTSINGQHGVRFVEAINLKTSAGFPWNESKKKHMFTESGDWDEERFVKDHIQEELNRILDCWTKGQSANPVSKASLKDEPRKFKKIEEKNTRVFYGSSLPFTIAQRQLFLWFARLVQRNPFLFMMAPGMDASGPQWDQLYRHLFEFSQDAIAGDFKNFDITMSSEELHVAYDFIIELAERLGAEELHLSLMRACAEDVIHVLIDYFGTLIRLTCNPSGQALTVLINGIVNIIRLMTVFALGTGATTDEEVRSACDEFFVKVRVMVYGDDNIASVKDAAHFTHTVLQDKLAEMGITYTMADKDKESIPYITYNDATFLKRGFRYEEELQRWVAPLEEASMVKMLGVYIPSKVESMEQQLSQSIMNCHREAFLHGREKFLYWDKLIRYVLEDTEVEQYVTLHDWNYYIDWYRSKETVVEQSGTACRRCGFDCYFVNYVDDEDMRECQFCKRCRFDEADLDCLYCGLEDSCERCGKLFELEIICDIVIRGERTRMYDGKCTTCEYKKSFIRLLTQRPNGLGRGDGVSLNQNSSL